MDASTPTPAAKRPPAGLTAGVPPAAGVSLAGRHAASRRSWLAAFALLAALPPWAGPASAQDAAPPDSVRVYLPDAGNLQWMSFWVALGAGREPRGRRPRRGPRARLRCGADDRLG